MSEAEMFERSFQRPKNFFKLSPEQQWRIDDDLGILDWVGGNLTEAEKKRFKDHYITSKPKQIFRIEEHSEVDKSFQILGPGKDDCFIDIAYDDVNHPEVDAVAETIVEILNANWDSKLVKEKYKEKLTQRWNEEKELQEEYTLAEYLKTYV